MNHDAIDPTARKFWRAAARRKVAGVVGVLFLPKPFGIDRPGLIARQVLDRV